MRAFIKLIGIAAFGAICGAGMVLAYRAGAGYSGAGAAAGLPSAPSPINNQSGQGQGSLQASAPLWLVIPAINVDAPVKAVGVNAEGALGVPSDAVHVAWYKYGPEPGMPGAAVIDGHLDTKTSPQAVFYDLDKLHPGDEVDVRTVGGQTIAFTVTKVEAIPYNATDAQIQDLFTSPSGTPELNLITCAGDWMPAKKMYSERFAVFTQRAD